MKKVFSILGILAVLHSCQKDDPIQGNSSESVDYREKFTGNFHFTTYFNSSSGGSDTSVHNGSIWITTAADTINNSWWGSWADIDSCLTFETDSGTYKIAMVTEDGLLDHPSGQPVNSSFSDTNNVEMGWVWPGSSIGFWYNYIWIGERL